MMDWDWKWGLAGFSPGENASVPLVPRIRDKSFTFLTLSSMYD